jgi:ATP-dependent RNA helicase HelY
LTTFRSNRRYHQRGRSVEHGERRIPRSAPYENPRTDPALKSVFKKIGIPEAEPFVPDPFQVEALRHIEAQDVLVSAPTGAGKTWIATQAIYRCLERGLSVWYASPLKALSNSIYQEFSKEFGPGRCGIITGDRKENPDGPVIVGTTEILRNQLYDAMHEGTSVRADLVVLDEAHYLADPDRGVVWEEVLIYLPARVRLLLLSATISNAEEVCDWLSEIRGTSSRVVRAEERPVPLEFLFLFPDGLVSPLAGKREITPRVKKFMAEWSGKRGHGAGRLHFGRILEVLRRLDLLPAIFFLKSRVECDRALLTLSPPPESEEVRRHLRAAVNRFVADYPHLKHHRQMRALTECLVGSHHGGQLPYWKVLVEKTMNQGYLEAIFSTSTVAAGVNFPARTVVLVQSDRYNGREFIDLTATDLHQMIGRAGRRGKDRIGFVLVIPGLHQDPELIHELRDSPPEPLQSQIRIDFSMTLNLLLSHMPLEVKDLLDRSFAAFQRKRSDDRLRAQWEALLDQLRKALPKGKCDVSDPYEIVENIQKRKDLTRRSARLLRRVQHERRLQSYGPYLQPGRIFRHTNGKHYVLFHVTKENGWVFCAAHPVMKRSTAAKRRMRLRRVDLDQIDTLFDYRLELPQDDSYQQACERIAQVPLETLVPLPEVVPASAVDPLLWEDREEMGVPLPCDVCAHLESCHGGKKGQVGRLLKDLRALSMNMRGMAGGLWLSFRRHLRFLKETGFVDHDDRLTADGIWASKLRLDQPLLIAEAIRRGGFNEATPPTLAGGLAPFVWDRVQEVDLNMRPGLGLTTLETVFNRTLNAIEPMRRLMAKRGFETPQILFWPAAALYLWARGMDWTPLMNILRVDEGDLASLIMRTADHLRQVTNLAETHTELAGVAREAIAMILREPVFIE